MPSGSCHDHSTTALSVGAGGEEVLRRAGLDSVVRHLGGMGRAIGQGHQGLRAAERAAALNLAHPTAMSAVAERDLAVARRHARQARTLLKSQLSGDTWREAKKQLGAKAGEFEESLVEAREYWIRAVDKADVPAQDAVEMVAIWDEVTNAAKSRGVDGIFKHLDESFAAAEKQLTAEENFGRQAHSPLEWWQWVIIAVIVGVGIAALVVCLIWFGCSWIYSIFVAICWGTGAVGGWAGICAGFTF
jgi:hypothetical protein